MPVFTGKKGGKTHTGRSSNETHTEITGNDRIPSDVGADLTDDRDGFEFQS